MTWRVRPPLYTTWMHINIRCFKSSCPAYHNYGGRGITVYAPWIKDFKAFAEYVQTHLGNKPSPKHTLDRIENNKGYVPGNLRWATQKTQMNNTRRTRMVEFKGELKPLEEWARELNVNYFTLHSRLFRLSWSIEKAFKTPSPRWKQTPEEI